MGGNVRYAHKGPDRRTSVCEECDDEFTHGKFSHPTYCTDCREERKDPEGIETELDVDVDMSQNTLQIELKIINNNDVPYGISLERSPEEHVDVVGYIRLSGGEFASEDVWLRNRHYSTMNIRENSSVTQEFVWDTDELIQQNKPTQKYEGVVGENFRESVAMNNGNPFDEDQVAAAFFPNAESTALTKAVDSVRIPDYLIDL